MLTLLIPAAGFGQRMGGPPAKELLIRPNTNKAFIDWPLELALENNWRVLVISREDKTNLNNYIENYILKNQAQNHHKISSSTKSSSIILSNDSTRVSKPNQSGDVTRVCMPFLKNDTTSVTSNSIPSNAAIVNEGDLTPFFGPIINKELSQIELLKITTSMDWYDTLLQSQNHWSEHNIVFLPDVNFGPLNILDQLAIALNQNEVAVATHQEEDSENWGHIYEENGQLCIAEKPRNYEIPRGNAWGLFGFQKNAGADILQAQWKSHLEQKKYTLKKTASFFSLDFFYDLTRNASQKL